MGVTSGLLDTSVIVAGLSEDDAAFLPDQVAVSVMTLGELHAGVLLARSATSRAARLARLADVHREFAILDITPLVAQRFGELRAQSDRRAVADILIAATALAHDMILVTRDRRQAAMIPGARVLGP